MQKIINEISCFIKPSFDGNREIFNKINNGFSIYRDDYNLPNLFIELIDFNNYDNNILELLISMKLMI